MNKLQYEHLASNIIDCCFQVHATLGPGLLESAYQRCLVFELNARGITCDLEKPMPLIYKGKHLNCGYRIDLLVDNKIILELKAVDALLPIHTAQLITYLKLAERPLGFLINFNVVRIKDGIKRVVYKY